jgi:hypothetical protein
LAHELLMLQWMFDKDIAGLIICIRIQL